MKTRKDSSERIWNYNDAEGCWTCDQHAIGCGRNNGAKWQVWDGPCKGYYEYKTLKDAMDACK